MLRRLVGVSMSFFAFFLSIFLSSISYAQDFSDWSQLCDSSGELIAGSAEVPSPNYGNPAVNEAVESLNKVDSSSWYMYQDIEKLYGLCPGTYRSDGYKHCSRDRSPYDTIPKTVSVPTHNFLTILCAEYRDLSLIHI